MWKSTVKLTGASTSGLKTVWSPWQSVTKAEIIQKAFYLVSSKNYVIWGKDWQSLAGYQQLRSNCWKSAAKINFWHYTPSLLPRNKGGNGSKRLLGNCSYSTINLLVLLAQKSHGPNVNRLNWILECGNKLKLTPVISDTLHPTVSFQELPLKRSKNFCNNRY